MHASTIGERAAFVVRPQALEAIKWLALALMLVEHASFYVFQQMPTLVMLLGRSVFPLFALALAVGVSGMQAPGRALVLVRLASWGIVAVAAGSLIRDAFPANVLFTLGLGLALHSALLSGHWSRYFVVFGCVIAGFAVEYGALGVIAVALVCGWGREQGTQRGYLKLVAAVVAISLANGNAFAMFAPLIAFAIDRGEIDVPRVRRFFYWAYAGQWPVFAVLKVLL